jgi:uracil-DNA glycosylase
MLCVENDDPAAENLANMMDAASVRANDVLLWNAYPWYINGNPTSAQINAGLDPLYRLLDLLPHLEVVLLQGRVAQVSWERAVNARPEILDRELTVVSTYHPARQALFHPSAEVREMRRRDRIDKMNLVGSLLRSTRS